MNNLPTLLLASSSPRRKQLLALSGLDFSTASPGIDESQLPSENPEDYVRRLAEAKSQAAAQQAQPQQLVIGSDTTVLLDGQTLGKPANHEEAEQMLLLLRGRTHQVLTGIAITRAQDNKTLVDICKTDVPMRAYTQAEIDAYIASGDPFDKAGAYAIQHPEFNPVESMEGCFASVMGFPLCHMARMLKRLEVSVKTDMPDKCQNTLNYSCPVFQSILDGNPDPTGEK